MPVPIRPTFFTLVLCGLVTPLLGDSVLTVQDRMLLPNDGRADDMFGGFMPAITGDTVVIGARHADHDGDCIVDGRDLELLLGQWSDGG